MNGFDNLIINSVDNNLIKAAYSIQCCPTLVKSGQIAEDVIQHKAKTV